MHKNTWNTMNKGHIMGTLLGHGRKKRKHFCNSFFFFFEALCFRVSNWKQHRQRWATLPMGPYGVALPYGPHWLNQFLALDMASTQVRDIWQDYSALRDFLLVKGTLILRSWSHKSMSLFKFFFQCPFGGWGLSLTTEVAVRLLFQSSTNQDSKDANKRIICIFFFFLQR